MNIKCSSYKAKKIKSQVKDWSGVIETKQKMEGWLKKDNAQKTKGILQYTAVWKKVLS